MCSLHTIRTEGSIKKKENNRIDTRYIAVGFLPHALRSHRDRSQLHLSQKQRGCRWNRS